MYNIKKKKNRFGGRQVVENAFSFDVVPVASLEVVRVSSYGRFTDMRAHAQL